METLQIRKTSKTELEEAVARLAMFKEAKAAAEEAYESQQAKVLALMGERKSVSIPWTASNERLKASRVVSTYITYNEVTLKKSLGASVWRKVSTTKLDTKKLEQAVQEGLVDVNTVAAHAEEREKKPFIRLSVGSVDAEDA